MEIIEKKIEDITPYEKNPRRNDKAVDAVANSIKEFGFKVPIVIDKDGIIVAGHTRYKAAKKLRMKSVPCIVASDLTDEQIKAFRLADNKVSELSDWDIDLLNAELDDIVDFDMGDFGFDLNLGDETYAVDSEVSTSGWFDRDVSTSFVTNLEPNLIVRTAPALAVAVMQANCVNLGENVNMQMPKYSYPSEVITSAMVARWCSRGVDFKLHRESAMRISTLDAQRPYGKSIYGNGFLLSENAARDAEAAACEAADAESIKGKKPEYVWELSERERGIVAGLGKNDGEKAVKEE